MIFDILKGIVLVMFIITIFIVGFFAEVICSPTVRHNKSPLINSFIDELWENSYKH